jgi:ubiquinone/menaquinone biosynthesis C-methylase UbiE
VSSSNRNAALKEYGKLAPEYDRRWSFYIKATLRETLSRIKLQPGDSFLDVGCGTGALLDALAASVPNAKLSGADASPEMLEVARKRLGEGVVLRQSYADHLPFSDEAFDVIVSTSAFHYFRDPAGSLQEMARVLRPNGCIVITDWCDDYIACRLYDLWLRVFNRAHFRTYGREECRHLLEEAGFIAVRIDRYRISWLWGLMTGVGQKRAVQQGDAAAAPPGRS